MRNLLSSKSLMKCRSGMAMVEFAICLPILILMLFGIIELSRYAVINQKLDKAANALADFVTQGTTVSVSQLNTYTGALPEIMRPFGFNGTVIFTSAAFQTSPCTDPAAPCIAWQRRTVGTDNTQISTNGSDVVMPGGYTLSAGQDVIVTEITYNYEPLLEITGTIIPALQPQKIYKSAVYKPRQSVLTILNPS